MPYRIKKTSRFKKDFKKILRSGRWTKTKNAELEKLIDKLANKETLDAKYQDHQLTNYEYGEREFHFEPDLLVVYSYVDDVLVLSLARIGSHSELF
jgi:mRNA interferase YafQ